VQKNCSRLLDELETAMPTVVFSARSGGDGVVVSDAAVQVDGVLVLDRLTGTPTPIDPGAHVVTFRWRDKLAEVRTFVSVGEKNRLLVGRFDGAAPSAPAPTPATSAEGPAPRRAESGGRALPLVFGAAGLASVGVFGYLGLSTLSDLHDLEHSPCGQSHTCNSQDTSSIHTRFAVADAALGVGVIALGVAAWLWWTR
jgi:hypothetical protein